VGQFERHRQVMILQHRLVVVHQRQLRTYTPRHGTPSQQTPPPVLPPGGSLHQLLQHYEPEPSGVALIGSFVWVYFLFIAFVQFPFAEFTHLFLC